MTFYHQIATHFAVLDRKGANCTSDSGTTCAVKSCDIVRDPETISPYARLIMLDNDETAREENLARGTKSNIG